MKWLRRILWSGVLLLVVLMIFSRLMAWHLGKDIEVTTVEHESYRFQAERDQESGVWKIDANSPDSLWFAMGYLQTWDREFQLELLRLAARGEASRMVGETLLNNDRLMRFSKRLAEAEWLEASDEVKRAAEAFVAGRQKAQANAELRVPVEYEIMGLKRSDFDPWLPQDILAIARLHSWQLSFDASTEALFHKIQKSLGDEKAKFLMPYESQDSKALYDQERLYIGSSKQASLRRFESSATKLAKPLTYFPAHDDSQVLLDSEKTEQSTSITSHSNEWYEMSWSRGASNLWVIADPRVGKDITLCNDAHLQFTWPASFYPIQYELKGLAKSAGAMLLGVPAVVIGNVLDLSKGEEGSLLSWGLTSASYVDSQDLVLINEESDKKTAQKKWESYAVRNLQTGQVEIRRFEETWTEYGPRVDGIYSGFSRNEQQWIALDWLGFKSAASPTEFFVSRNLRGAQNLVEDLHSKFSYPNFNFTWIEQRDDKSVGVGHLLTGWIRSRSGRHQNGIAPLTPSTIKSHRHDSAPSDREYFYRSYTHKDPFFLVSANQKVWNNSDTQYAWEPQGRAQKIIENFEALTRDPAASQVDYHAPALYEFYQRERSRVRVDRLCSDVQASSSQCLEWVAKLDAWRGNASVDSWETSLVALWHAKYRADLFLWLLPEEEREASRKLMESWHNRFFSSHVFNHARSESAKVEKTWESWSSKSLNELSAGSFQWALNQLIKDRGANPSLWRWGLLHRMSFTHPLAKAPEPWGALFQDSLLGPRMSVGGALDSSGRFDYDWKLSKPMEFAAVHGAGVRMCSEFSRRDGKIDLKMQWSFPTGPSGNPFSRHSKRWSFETFYKDKNSIVNF